tara:strand:+ start:1093 stop:1782 length:690 start_codon:yes stop_codon:yes gene_type:complete
LTEQPACSICNDAGILHVRNPDGSVAYEHIVACACQRERLDAERMKSMLQYCELPYATAHMTFEKFNKRVGTEEAYDVALQFATGKSEFKWLTLMSGVDRGKTHLGIAICRRWLTTGKAARYIYVPLLLDELRRGYSPLNNDDSYDRKLDLLFTIPLLVLDDLGAESPTAWAQEKIELIVDYRCVNGLALVVTTNKKMDELPVRIASRLQRHGKVVVINAIEHRLDVGC